MEINPQENTGNPQGNAGQDTTVHVQPNVGTSQFQPPHLPPATQNQNPSAPSSVTAVSSQQQLPATQASRPIYGKDGRLTRDGMIQQIRAGGSVLVDGKHYSRVEDLPTSAALAQTPTEKAVARSQLEQQRRELDNQLASLGDAPTPAPQGNRQQSRNGGK